jgi:hypothetical protein
VIEVYAITDHPAPPLPDVGPLHVVAAGELEAVFAPADDGEASPEALWRREEIVEALMEDRDLLPVRYGTCLDDDAAAAHALEERYQELGGALDRVRGAVELSVRVLAAQEDGEPGEPQPRQAASSGSEYLRAKARAGRAVQSLHEPLARLARASTQRPGRAPGELLRAAYLVDRGSADGFVERVASLQSTSPGLRLLCTGPWPPYSFAQQ